MIILTLFCTKMENNTLLYQQNLNESTLFSRCNFSTRCKPSHGREAVTHFSVVHGFANTDPFHEFVTFSLATIFATVISRALKRRFRGVPSRPHVLGPRDLTLYARCNDLSPNCVLYSNCALRIYVFAIVSAFSRQLRRRCRPR